MSDEKPKEHESKEHEHESHHEHHSEPSNKSEGKTITIKKDTLWKAATVVFLALFVVSLFTGGFGIGGMTGNAANTGAANTANANTGATASAGDTSVITSDPNLFPTLGPSNAKNTVIELADFQCPYCALASGLPNWTTQYQSQYGSLIGSAKQMESLAQQGKIRFIFVPLSFLDNPSDANGPESTQAAQAAFCADNQGKFWQMHDAIYAASTGPTEDDGKYSIPNLEKIAATISGIDTAKFNNCLETNATLSRVQQVMTTIQKAGFQIATPQFFVNGKSVTPSTTALMSAVGQ